MKSKFSPRSCFQRQTAYFSRGVMAAVLFLSGCAVPKQESPSAEKVTEPAMDVTKKVEKTDQLSAEFIYEYLLSDIAARRGHTDESLNALVRLAESTGNINIIRRAFRSAMHGKNGQIALQMSELLIERDSNEMRAAFAHIQALMLLGDSTKAIQRIQGYLEKPGADISRILNNASEVFVRQADPGEFVDPFKKLTDQFPDNADGLYALAYLANRAGNMPVLKQAINQALVLRPKWEEAALVNFSYLVNQDGWKSVMTFVEEFLKRNPDADSLRSRYARYMVGQRQMKEAINHFAWLIRKYPEDSEALLAGSIVRMQLKQFKYARRYLIRYIKLKPNDDQARLYLGQVELDSNDFPAAIGWLSEIRDDQFYIDAQIRISDAIKQIDNTEAALHHLRELIPTHPGEEVKIYQAQEQLLRSDGRFDEARRLMDAAIQDIPDNPELYYSRALLAAELNLLELHESDIRRVIELDPDNAHAYNALGYTLADQTPRIEEAFELITQALSLAPNDPFILDSMGWVNYRMGRIKEAINYLRRAMDIRDDAEIAAHLGEALWVDGQRAEAEKIWQNGIKADPMNQTLLKTLKRLKDQ